MKYRLKKTVGKLSIQQHATLRRLNLMLSGMLFCSMGAVMVQTASAESVAPAFTIKIVPQEKIMPAMSDMKTSTVMSAGSNNAVPPNSDERAIHLHDGGVLWVSQDSGAITPRLSIQTSSRVILDNAGQAPDITFNINSNYTNYIDRWELAIYREDDHLERNPVGLLKAKTLSDKAQLQWDGQLRDGQSIQAGDVYHYRLRVYNAQGHMDETGLQSIQVVTSQTSQVLTTGDNDLDQDDHLLGGNHLVRQTIPVYGGRVRIHGRGIDKGTKIKINSQSVTLDSDGKFVNEYLMPTGDHKFQVAVVDANNQQNEYVLKASLDGKYLFMVGLADVTVGESKISGNIESLSVDDRHYGGDIFVDGRLAFYVKGKIKGKYLVTAQMDTGTADVEHLFDGFLDKEPESIFRRLDPDKYYPVYGDDSTLIDDTDSQGKLYVRVDWDKSRAIWGNYNTAISGNEFAQFNRSLYGAQFSHKSTQTTHAGDHKRHLKVFASEAESAYGHNQFLGTGGSLYYLKHTDIVDGSEKVWVEVRQRETERVVERITLEAGSDYEIDDFQGRILLTRPLHSTSEQSGPAIIKDTPLDGNDTYLMVDYEYIPENDLDKASYGVRGKTWLNDHVAVGGTWVHENRNDQDYDVKGADITLKKNRGTYLKFDYAETESIQTRDSYTSDDGGLNFDAFSSNDSGQADVNSRGKAYGVEARAELADLKINQSGSIGAWYKQRDKGYSIASIDTATKTTDTGVEGKLQVNERIDLSARGTMLEKYAQERTTTASVQGDYRSTDKVTLSAEVRHVKEENLLDRSQDGEGALGAIKVGYDASQNLHLYVIGQGTLNKQGAYENNDLYTAGARVKLSDKLSWQGEVSHGDRGNGGKLGVDYKLNSSHSLYGNYTINTDRTDVERGVFTVGQRKQITDALKIFAEHQYTHEDTQAGLGHTFGLDYQLNKYVLTTLSVQHANLENDHGDNTRRQAISTGITYQKDKVRASSKLEHRQDNGSEIDTEQWVTSNRINYQFNPSLRLQGKLNHSWTKGRQSDVNDAQFTEFGIGFAYRPVSHDRLNILGKLSYLRDLQPDSQSNTPDEQSMIASVESSYQLNQRWEVGGKLAYRQSKLRENRGSGSWTANDASLLAVRVRYHLNHQWDALAQYQWMNSDASGDTQHGALISIDRHINKHLKVGIGYNFADFTDDLQDDNNGQAKGWFINIVGKY